MAKLMKFEERSHPAVRAILFSTAAIVAWTFYVLLMLLAPDPFTNDMPRALARVSIVLLPALLHISWKQEGMIGDYSRLDERWFSGSVVGLAFAGSYLLIAVILPMTAPSLMLTHSAAAWLNFIVGSPIAEELLFRWVLFNELSRITKWYWAMLISAVMFAVLHLPVWILLENMSMAQLTQSFVQILVYGLIFAVLMRATKSFWAPLTAHCVNNFILQSVVDGAMV